MARRTKTLTTPDWLKVEQEEQRHEAASGKPKPLNLQDNVESSQKEGSATSKEEILSEEEIELRYLRRRVEEMKSSPYPLSPSTLEDLFRPTGAERLRLCNSPLEQYGFIFNLDVMCPTSSADQEAWKKIAEIGDYEIDEEEAFRGSRSSNPIDVMVGKVLGEREPVEARKLGMGFFEERNRVVSSEEYLENLEVEDGCLKWMAGLRDAGCMMACYSRLPRYIVDEIMGKMGIETEAVVTPEDGWDTLDQVVLGGSMELMKQPSKCLVFDESPSAAIRTHEAGMKFVGLLGTYPRYELGVADKTIGDFDELKMRDIRGVFGEEQGYELELEVDDGMGGAGGSRRNRNDMRWE